MNKLLVCFLEEIMCLFAIETGFLGSVLGAVDCAESIESVL